MDASPPPPADGPQPDPRRDLTLVNVNAAIWAVGNGLASTTLVTYLALEWGAKGLIVSLVLAAPRFAGVLRLGAPALLAVVRARRALCVAAFVSGSMAILLMLNLAVPGRWLPPGVGLAALAVGWSVYHLLEYVGGVLLWSWLGDLMPRAERGRLIGRRERWLTFGRVIGIGVSFGLAVCWRWIDPQQPRWLPLFYSACVGAVLMTLAAAPLAMMQPADATPSARPRDGLRSLLRCLADRPYRRLLTFSCAFAFANGMTNAAQGLYPFRVLGVRYEHMLMLRALMRAGQGAVAPRIGGWIDRFGAKGVLFAAQLIVATGPLFFLGASAAAPWWLLGAFVAWIAYAAHNVGLNQQKLAVAPVDNNTPAIAGYHAISDLVNGAVTVLGGLAFDRLVAGDDSALRLYAQLFLAGWLARTLVAGLLLRLVNRPAERFDAPRPHGGD